MRAWRTLWICRAVGRTTAMLPASMAHAPGLMGGRRAAGKDCPRRQMGEFALAESRTLFNRPIPPL